MIKKIEFAQDDFAAIGLDMHQRCLVAERANREVEPINKALEGAKVVYSCPAKNIWDVDNYGNGINVNKALLINITEIEKKCETCGKYKQETVN